MGKGLSRLRWLPLTATHQLTSKQIQCGSPLKISNFSTWLIISHSATTSTAPAAPRPALILPIFNLPELAGSTHARREPDLNSSVLAKLSLLLHQSPLLPLDHITQPVANMAAELRVTRPRSLARPLGRRLDRNIVTLGQLLATNPLVRAAVLHSESLS
jgi:hypothetical protein